MKLFTEYINEAKKEYPVISLDTVNKYMQKIKGSKSVSKDFLTLLNYCTTLNMLQGEPFEERIINGGRRDAEFMQANWGGPLESWLDMQRIVKKMRNTGELKGLPLLMTEEDINSIIAGEKTFDDIVLDLETEKGREQCIKNYGYLVPAIARKYQHSGMDWNGLISAGYLGLTKAMNDYHKPDDYVDMEHDNPDKQGTKKAKALSFKQYAGWRIRQQILNDINELSRTVRISQYQYEKNKKEGNTKGNFNTVSIDMAIDDDGNTIGDRMMALSNMDGFNDNSANRGWEKIYRLIDNKFSTRTASIFYKYFGLNGYKQQKGVEIAREMGITGAAVSMSVKDVMKFLKNNKETRNILMDLLSMYSESLMYTNTPDSINDAMISDDVLIMLKESTQWFDKRVFNNGMGSAMEFMCEDTRDFIIRCLESGIDYIDEQYNAHRLDMMTFLENVYPAECIRRKKDIEIINMMVELSDNFQYHNVSE